MDINQARDYTKNVLNLSKAERKRMYDLLGLTTTTNGQTRANIGLKASTDQLTGSLWKSAVAWAKTPFGATTIAGVVIFAIIKAIDLLTVSLEEQREELAKARDEYKELASELKTLNSELETTKSRIEELQALQKEGTISLVQKEELDNLQAQSRELQRQIALQEALAAQKQKEVNEAFIKTFEKDVKDGREFTTGNVAYAARTSNAADAPQIYTTYSSEEDHIKSQFDKLKDLKDQLAKAEEEWKKDVTSQTWENTVNSLKTQVAEIEEYLTNRATQFSTDIENVSRDEDTEEALDYIDDFLDRYAIAMGQAGAKESAIWRLLDEQFIATRESLYKLGDQNAVTAALMNDPAYDTFIAKLLELGVITADDEENLSFVALAFKEIAEAAKLEATPSLTDLIETLDKLKSSTELLVTAEEEMKSGGLTPETIKALAEQTDNYLDYLYVENGLVKLNTEAWQEYINTLQGNNIANLESRITSLKAENASITAAIVDLENIETVSDGRNIDGMDGVMHYSDWNNQMESQKKRLEENEKAIAKAEHDLELYIVAQEAAARATKEATHAISDQVKVLQNSNTVANAMGILSEIYSDVQDGNEFDWSSILDNEEFAETFGNLGSAYSDFITTIANSSGDINACQDAFNRLASAYIMSSDALDGVTESNRNAVVAMLEQNGVANVSEIVDAKLINNKIALADTTDNLTDSIGYYISALYNESGASESATQAAAALQMQKYLVNAEQIRTTSDIDQLIALANAAGATAESLARLEKAKQILSGVNTGSSNSRNITGLERPTTNALKGLQAVAIEYAGGSGGGLTLDEALAQIQALLSEPFEFDGLSADDFTVSFSPYSGSSSSTSSDADNWFERQYALHQHLLEMDAEEAKAYLDWLQVAYKQAYNEGLITLDDYYGYTEEVYKGLQDLYMEHLSDKEHEISMRENYESEAAAILAIYRELVEDVSDEINRARNSGLDDNDDYLQGLLDKYWEYTNAIKEMQDEATDNAKDAVDELVDLRIDMLKQELENQKDSLNERLDALKDFYDKQKEMLQDVYDEEKYLEEQAEKRKAVSDLQANIDMLANDDSAWAQKRRIELEEELANAKKELDDFEKDHALETTQELLEEQLKLQEDQINSEIDALDEKLNDPHALFNLALADIANNTHELYNEFIAYNRKYGLVFMARTQSDLRDKNYTYMLEPPKALYQNDKMKQAKSNGAKAEKT